MATIDTRSDATPEPADTDEVVRLRAELDEANGVIGAMFAELVTMRGWVPPGHFYSPLPDIDDVKARDEAIFAVPEALAGIDLRTESQLALVDTIAGLVEGHPFGDAPTDGLRYGFDNVMFSYGDALVLHGLLQHLTPRRVIEIGSGWSSALMLDTNDRLLGGATTFTFIEPNPERLLGLLREADHDAVTLHAVALQAVDRSLFSTLEPGDILFVDSSHVSKVGSDVNEIVFEVLPLLPEGVWVHFHDIHYPFEYPRELVYSGWAWNESYLLRAFLEQNSRWQIELFNSYLRLLHHDRVDAALPLWARYPGSSLWLRRV